MQSPDMEKQDTEQQDRLHRIFAASLDLLDRQNREPDRWEEECLSYALGAMACDLYSVAEVELEAFARPIAQRPELDATILNGRSQRFTKEMLRHGLDYVLHKGEGPSADLAVPAAVAAGQFELALSSSSNIRSAT